MQTFCKINGIAPSFLLLLPEVYLKSSPISKKERFPKTVSSWIKWTVFAKTFVLNGWLGCEYVSDYPDYSLLTWDTLTHVSTVSTSENDYQANTVGRK